MPRRPRKQPRALNGVVGAGRSPAPGRNGDAMMKKWTRRGDIEGDEEDNFHAARDRILLEGDDAEVDDEDDGEEEVFGLGIDDYSSVSEAEEESVGAEDNLVGGRHTASAPPQGKKVKQYAPQSKSSTSESESEESESWGRNKSAYYASNAALLSGKDGENDEEEANEMEEQEARRLQARMREGMQDDDYGLDDAREGAAEDAGPEVDEPAGASKNSATPEVHLDKSAALRRLEKTSPETLALAREWDDVARDLMHVQERLDKMECAAPDPLSLGLSHLHHQTLLTYVTTLAFYLHLRAGTPQTSQSQPSPQIKPVLARLLTLKQALATMEELELDASDDEEEWDSDLSSLDEEEHSELNHLVGRGRYGSEDDMNKVWGKGRRRLEEGELEALLKDADDEVRKERPKKKAKRNKEETFNDVGGQKPVPKTFDLVEPEFVPTARSATRPIDGGLEAYGEVATLSMVDNADKMARKRTLRFHTDKIETSARRKGGARERMGGDDDLPYQERKKEKESRTQRQVEKDRGKGGDDLDHEQEVDTSAGAGTPTSLKRRRDEEDSQEEQEGEDGYYELVKRAKKEQKENKKQQYEGMRLAERFDIDADELTSGPRTLTRAILKNKGLTPRRSKNVRNPRVKKREQFEKAKKKVRSQKATYKGGLAGKPYGGEESGITKVVKSIKL